jgi:FKBP-type peptidyl-prolyl cis-trans isomerase
MKRVLAATVLFTTIGCASNDPAGPSSVQSEDLVVGTGAVAATGDTLTVNYIGRLQNGTVFDDSYARGQAFTFRLGAGQVIRGWDLGLPGMRAGGKRRLTIPPGLAYGSSGNGPIPPNATIVFDVELMSIAGK